MYVRASDAKSKCRTSGFQMYVSIYYRHYAMNTHPFTTTPLDLSSKPWAHIMFAHCILVVVVGGRPWWYAVDNEYDAVRVCMFVLDVPKRYLFRAAAPFQDTVVSCARVLATVAMWPSSWRRKNTEAAAPEGKTHLGKKWSGTLWFLDDMFVRNSRDSVLPLAGG